MSTETKVITLLDTLQAANEEMPTIREIRQRIGKGSLTTISRAVQVWKISNKVSENTSSGIPEELTDAVSSTILKSIWAGVRPLLAEQIAAQKNVHAAQMNRLSGELKDAVRSLEEAQDRCLRLEAEVNALKKELRDAMLARAKAEGALEAFQSLKR